MDIIFILETRITKEDEKPRNPTQVPKQAFTDFTFCLFVCFFYRSGEVTSATILVKKLVAVLESTEKLPVFTYECPGSGLQVCVSCKY